MRPEVGDLGPEGIFLPCGGSVPEKWRDTEKSREKNEKDKEKHLKGSLSP